MPDQPLPPDPADDASEADAVETDAPEAAVPEAAVPEAEADGDRADHLFGIHPPAHTLPEAREITRARASDLRRLLNKYVRRHLPAPAPRAPRVDEPPRMVGAHAKALPILRTIPWILGALFLLSFAWDFPGVRGGVFGYGLVFDGLLRTLSVSGLIGYLTNWLAITMLFNPRERRPVFGQGLIPAQRERVIYRLAKAISEELINEQIIKQKIEESQVIPRYRELALTVTRGVLEDPDFRGELKDITGDYVQQVLGSEDVRRKIVDFTVQKIEQHAGEGLGGLALKAYRLVNEADFQRRIDQAIQELPHSVDGALDQMDHLLDRVPALIEARSDEIEDWATRVVLGFVENLDVYDMIMTNMRQYDEQQLEDLLKKTSNEQLNYIKYLGGILGLFGGLVIWEPVLALSVFGSIGLALYGIDEALYRARTA